MRTEAAHAGVSHATVDLVILSDSLVADPRLVRDLHSQSVPHLPVRVRDGIGLVGPAGDPRRDQLPGELLGGFTRVRSSSKKKCDCNRSLTRLGNLYGG